MWYLIHASLLLAACFVYYWVALRHETHFTLNRWVLLGCLIGSLALPLITVPAAWSFSEAIAETPVETIEQNDTPVVNAVSPEAAPALWAGTGKEAEAATIHPKAPSAEVSSNRPTEVATSWTSWFGGINWARAAWWLYLTGVLVFSFNFLLQLGQLLVRIIRNPGHDLGEFRLVEMREDEAPFSFWNRIFLNPNRYDEDTFHQIVQHEQIHVNQKHSLDLLLAEAVVILQWFNPFAWLYRKAIEHNLEYLTDAEMLRGGNDAETYQLSLVKVAIPNFPNGLVASYNQSFLEKRITMMKTRKSSLRSGWKYFTILPLLLLSVLQFNAVAQAPVPPAFTSPTHVPVVPSPALHPNIPPAPAPATPAVPTMVPAVNANITPAQVSIPTPVPAGNLRTNNDLSASLENTLNSWVALIEDDEVCFQFSSRKNAYNNSWNMQHSRCFAALQLGALPRNTMGEFTLARTSGKMLFKGIFDGNDGAGTFNFTPDADFEALLKKEGFGSYKEREMLLFFMADMNPEYLKFLRDQGYRPKHDKLLELSIFYDDLDELKNRLAELNSMGYERPTLSKLIELQIHGVSEKYARELKESGFKNLSLQDLIDARIHGVSSEFLTAMADSGFKNLNFDKAKSMAIHGIDADYVREMSELGYKNLDAKDIVNAKIHGLDAEKIAEFRRAGLTNLTLNEAKNLSIHGVSVEFVEALARFGFRNLSPKEITNAKIHGLSAHKLEALKSTGLPINDLREVQNASIHGVDAEYIAGMRAIGYKDLEMNDFVQAKIHGITPQWAASFREVGFRDIPIKTLISLRIHGVSPAFIKERQKDGRTLADYVKMKIHGL